jgi:phosphoribosylamine--glycine ligase
VTDGKTIRVLPSSQDHKRAYDNDEGPNTGGMGAYSPVPWCDSALIERVTDQVLTPTVEGLSAEGIEFCGVIYAGIMLDEKGNPRVLEYNVRLGDPEAQVVLPAFPGDWGQVVAACCEGRLAEIAWPEACRSAVGVVLASGGYPGSYRKGFPIQGLDVFAGDSKVLLFQAGTARGISGEVLTDGGRVLTVVGLDDDFAGARDRAYKALSRISFEEVHFRKDIGAKATRSQPFKRG